MVKKFNRSTNLEGSKSLKLNRREGAIMCGIMVSTIKAILETEKAFGAH